MTQKQRILDDLIWPPPYCSDSGVGVCGSLWLDARIPRYAARIGELRAEGHTIESGRCRWHKTATYTLLAEKGQGVLL